MSETKRRLGHSMIPRGTAQSTNEDSAEPENTPIPDEEKGIESEVPLEAVLGEKQPETPKTAKNSENEQPAADFSFENDEVANGGYSDPKKVGETQPLEDMLKASREPESVQNLESPLKKPSPYFERLWSSGVTLGQQPDGSYKLVVAVPEGYIEGVKSQAELDNMTPEDWVSQKLAEYFEQWWFAPKQAK